MIIHIDWPAWAASDAAARASLSARCFRLSDSEHPANDTTELPPRPQPCGGMLPGMAQWLQRRVP